MNCLNADHRQKTVQFFSEELGLLSSTIHSKAKENDIKRRYKNRGLQFKGIKKTRVNATTLNNVLKQYEAKISKGIDFVSIDVEGNELQVLRGFNIQKYAPRVIIIEANNEEAFQELDNYLVNANGYFFARRLNENLFYTRDNEDAKKISDITIDCVIEKQAHPLGEKHTPLQYIKGHVIDTEKEDLKNQINNNQKSLREKKLQLSKLSKEANTYKKKYKEKEQQVTNLFNDAENYKRVIKEKDRQVASLSNDAEAYQKQINKKEQEIKYRHTETQSYKEQIADKDARINNFIDDISKIKSDLQKMEEQIKLGYQTLEYKQQELNAIYNSRTWKLMNLRNRLWFKIKRSFTG